MELFFYGKQSGHLGLTIKISKSRLSNIGGPVKYFFFALISVTVQMAQANVQGSWAGWGDWLFDGSGDHCNMQLIYKESEQKLQRTAGRFDCSAVSLTLPEATWIKQGDQLLSEDGKVVGKWTADSIELLEQYSPTVSILTIIHTEALHMDYHEVWHLKDNSVLYDIKGRLFLHPTAHKN